MIILIDVDEVCANLMEAWIARYNKLSGDKLDYLSVNTWGLAGHVKKSWKDRVYKLLADPNLYDEVEPVPLALSSVQLLREWGHEVYFITSTMTPGRKLQWLRDHGFLDKGWESKKYYLEVDSDAKFLVHGDILIDDRFKTIEAFTGHGILFRRPHNSGEEWPNVADDWDSVLEQVSEFEIDAISSQHQQEAANAKIASMIAGVGPDAPIVTNEKGGTQSALPYRFDLVDPLVMFNLAHILDQGAKSHGLWNWREIPVNDNLNHALAHIYAHLAGDVQDDHLGHALCRLMFAKSIHWNPDPKRLMIPNRPEAV